VRRCHEDPVNIQQRMLPPVLAPGSSTRLTLALKNVLQTGGRVGIVHYVAAIFSVQGVAYLNQFMIARVVGPEDFAVVRTVEATLNVLLVAASFGMPMLAVTTIAGLGSERAQGRMLGALVALAVLGGLATAALASLASVALAPVPAAYLRIMAWVMPLAAASRTALNYFQGRQQVQRVAGYMVALSFISLAVVVAAVVTAGLTGWVVGRYLTELLFLTLLLWGVGPSLSLSGGIPGGHRVRSLLRTGSGIAASLLIRTAMDNAGLYLLVFSGAPDATVGYFGLSSLVLIVLSIIPTSLASIALPRMTTRLHDPVALRAFVRRVAGATIAVALVLAGAAALLARPAVDLLFPSYGEAVPILLLLLAAVPFRAVSTLCGVVLVACDRVYMTVGINLLALAVTTLTWAAGTSQWGAAGTAAAVVAGEVVGAGAYVIVAWSSLLTVSGEPGAGKGTPSV
jgi:O-antigen/teichoic acid export membrane protein